jgi:phage terminase small subunit
MNRREERFVLELAVDGNATQAATRAGYRPGYAAVTAHGRKRCYAALRSW